MQSRIRVFLGLGSNVGDRVANIISAIDKLSDLGVILKVSTLYESEPWGVENQPGFLNCVVEMQTTLEARKLLKETQSIERAVGRVKRFHWGPREIDIDILLYGEAVIQDKELKVPHPYIEERDFVLVPLLEIDKELVNPKTNRLFSDALAGVENRLKPHCSILKKRKKGAGAIM